MRRIPAPPAPPSQHEQSNAAGTEIAALAERVATARGKLPLQYDSALVDVLSEDEIAAERELAEWIRTQRRGQRRRALREELKAEQRDRRTASSIRRVEEADARWHRQALAARRRVSSQDARLAQLYRRAEWSSRALIGVVVLGMVWAGVNVQHNLVPSGDMSDPLYWLSYGIEAMISIPIITIMVVATTAARWGRELPRGKVAFFEMALLGTTIGLNAGPHLAAGHWAKAAEFSIAPIMVGVVIWLHAWVAARYAQLIDGVIRTEPADPIPLHELDTPVDAPRPRDKSNGNHLNGHGTSNGHLPVGHCDNGVSTNELGNNGRQVYSPRNGDGPHRAARDETMGRTTFSTGSTGANGHGTNGDALVGDTGWSEGPIVPNSLGINRTDRLGHITEGFDKGETAEHISGDEPLRHTTDLDRHAHNTNGRGTNGHRGSTDQTHTKNGRDPKPYGTSNGHAQADSASLIVPNSLGGNRFSHNGHDTGRLTNGAATEPITSDEPLSHTTGSDSHARNTNGHTRVGENGSGTSVNGFGHDGRTGTGRGERTNGFAHNGRELPSDRTANGEATRDGHGADDLGHEGRSRSGGGAADGDVTDGRQNGNSVALRDDQGLFDSHSTSEHTDNRLGDDIHRGDERAGRGRGNRRTADTGGGSAGDTSRSDASEKPSSRSEPVVEQLTLDADPGPEPRHPRITLDAIAAAREAVGGVEEPPVDPDEEDGVWAVARAIVERRIAKAPVGQVAEILTLADQSWTPIGIGSELGLSSAAVTRILEAARKLRHPYVLAT
ncbi:hypothetical protein ACFVMC_02270 [Nocardia sp. NPDC127579]|uniref:hypothetical protein n=1 Tax=Nocardia sp. NPDC127579 TaxID=3345402 RepID=UPI0036267339